MHRAMLAHVQKIVSIPIGFSSSLQLIVFLLLQNHNTTFQSLSGFQVRCNFRTVKGPCRTTKVSIPIGFSSSLQLEPSSWARSGSISFNPYRVFKFVATAWGRPTCSPSTTSFNPYRVFKFVATSTPQTKHPLDQGFNPYRVFKFVATQGSIWWHVLWRGVSIPIGFSSSLQRQSPFTNISIFDSFNPYRVFKFVATYGILGRPLSRHYKFQSLSGFQVRCNANFRATTFARYQVVSIPIGFSSSLQPRIFGTSPGLFT